jgi:hypothetical protein
VPSSPAPVGPDKEEQEHKSGLAGLLARIESSKPEDPAIDITKVVSVAAEDGFFDLDEEMAFYNSVGVNPSGPTAAKPGSEDKVRVLAARYAAGLPFWHKDDVVDHGPKVKIVDEDEEDLDEDED